MMNLLFWKNLQILLIDFKRLQPTATSRSIVPPNKAISTFWNFMKSSIWSGFDVNSSILQYAGPTLSSSCSQNVRYPIILFSSDSSEDNVLRGIRWVGIVAYYCDPNIFWAKHSYRICRMFEPHIQLIPFGINIEIFSLCCLILLIR